MKKIFSYILIVLIFIGTFFPLQTIHAETYGSCLLPEYKSPAGAIIPAHTAHNYTKIDCEVNNKGAWTAYADGKPIGGIGVGEGSDIQKPKAEVNCNILSGWGTCIVNGLSNIVTWFLFWILTLASFLLWLAGTLLDFVLQYTIIDLKLHIESLTGINIAWKLLRDLMNIGFIFLLVYEGIKLIIQQGNTTQIKKFITAIVLASLLINFSLFFTKILIDASNVVTIGFYKSILANSDKLEAPVDGSVTPPKPGESTRARTAISGLTVPFMNAMGMTTFWSTKSFEEMRKQANGSNISLMLTPLMGIILFIVVSFAFFAVSIIFIIRYLVLVILLMLSPIAYMGDALPFMSSYSKKWWDSLKGQLLFAPIYMLMTWVALTLMSSKGFIPSANWGEVINGSSTSAQSGPMGLILNFVIVIGLIIASIVIAKSTASQGSDLIGKATGSLTKFAGGAALGSSAALFRNTAGRLGTNIANSKTLKDRAAEGRRRAQYGLWASRKASSGTFDARTSFIGKQTATATGINLGKGTIFNEKAGEKGYKKIQDDKVKAEQEYVKSLKSSDEHYEAAKAEDKRIKEEAADAEKEKIKVDSLEFKPDETLAAEVKEANDNLEASKQKIREAKAEIEKLIIQRNTSNSPDEKNTIQGQIDLLIAQETAENEVNTKLKTIHEESQKKVTDARKKFDDDKKVVIDNLNIVANRKANTESSLNDEWNARKNSYADTVENRSITNYARGVFIPVGTSPTTKAERTFIAQKIRNETGKKKEMSAKERKKKMQEYAKDDTSEDRKKELYTELGLDKEDDDE